MTMLDQAAARRVITMINEGYAPETRRSTHGPCKHFQFKADVAIGRIEDIGRFVAEVQVRCVECDRPFQFLGVQPGFNFDGPTVSLDGLLASLPLCPKGAQPTPLQGLQGYTIKATN